MARHRGAWRAAQPSSRVLTLLTGSQPSESASSTRACVRGGRVGCALGWLPRQISVSPGPKFPLRILSSSLTNAFFYVSIALSQWWLAPFVFRVAVEVARAHMADSSEGQSDLGEKQEV